MTDPLEALAALGVEYTIVGDTTGGARVNIGNEGPTFGPVADAIRKAIEQHERRVAEQR